MHITLLYKKHMKDWTPESIEQLRKEHKLTRKVLGELVGVSIPAIYQWERGLRTPSRTAKLLLERIEQDLMKTRKEGKEHGKRNL